MTKRRFGPGEANELVGGGAPSTPDEVSITSDGRRLDSAVAVIEFLAELERKRSQEDSLATP